jgi:hypothetical protein
LGQEGRLELDFSSNPFALGVRNIRSVTAAAATTELGAKAGALNLIELLDLAPGLVAYGSGYVDL